MNSRIARRLDDVVESVTLKLNALATELKAKGNTIFNLTAGEPDFSVPPQAATALEAALKAGKSKYTPTAGIPELRAGVAERTMRAQPGLAKRWTGANVVVSNGAKHAIFNSLLALVNPGDEVVILAPYWLSYPEMTKIVGGIPVVIPSATDSQGRAYRPDWSQLEKAIRSARAKVLILNSPSNPTGAVLSREELRRIGEILLSIPAEKRPIVISDEIYDKIVYAPAAFTSFLAAVPELQEQVITVNGLSKSAAMTGWRIGWTVAAPDLTDAIARIQGQATSGINSLAQAAAVAALALPDSAFSVQMDAYTRRRLLVLDILSRSRTLEGSAPDGAFYVFVRCQKALRPGEHASDFAEECLTQAQVAVVPCESFGLSFATDEAVLKEGCERLVRFADGRKTGAS
jgi:aspartate aminotransferase